MTLRAYPRVLDALDAHGSHGTRNQYRCPGHDDDTPSLSVKDSADRVLVYCRDGCDTLDVLEKLR